MILLACILTEKKQNSNKKQQNLLNLFLSRNVSTTLILQNQNQLNWPSVCEPNWELDSCYLADKTQTGQNTVQKLSSLLLLHPSKSFEVDLLVLPPRLLHQNLPLELLQNTR